jgi:CheY-like chemotaxis protein
LAAQAKAIHIQTVFDRHAGQVAGDANRLQQVFWNLLSNAVKFTPQGGQVEIRLERVGTEAQIQVSDTGKGISPEFLPYVFDYFRQADSTTTRVFGGLGLGLAIVRQLVELHGGTVWAESPDIGCGATFTVRLPLMAVESEEPQENELISSSPNLEGVRVLVVDDEVDTLELLVFMLKEYGAKVRGVTEASEALLLISQWQPDLLLSDIGMPDVDGYMLIRQIRELESKLGRHIPAIALTAYAGETDHQQILASGFQKHVTKPVEPAKLVNAIASLVEHQQGEKRFP